MQCSTCSTSKGDRSGSQWIIQVADGGKLLYIVTFIFLSSTLIKANIGNAVFYDKKKLNILFFFVFGARDAVFLMFDYSSLSWQKCRVRAVAGSSRSRGNILPFRWR